MTTPATEAKRRITKGQRIAEALELRKTGAPFSQIGKALGLSKVRAFQLIAEALADLGATCAEKAEELRRLELERCDALQFKLWPQADNPRVADSILRVMERRAKLLGLDAPTKVAQTTPDGGTLPPALDLSKLTDGELEEMRRMYEKAGATTSSTILDEV